MEEKFKIQTKIFKAFCDEHRLKIIELLLNGEKCGCTLIEQTGLSQSQLSYHIKILCESGIIQGRQDGKWIHYSVNKENAKKAVMLLSEITNLP